MRQAPPAGASRGPRAALLAARLLAALCLLLLIALVALDAQAERFTAGLSPAQFSQRLEADLLDDYSDVLGVAHNAGDDVGAAKEAVAHGVDAVEIDVTSVAGELHASHDAPIPIVDSLFFRGPRLEEAWEAARLRDTVVLELKQSSPAYLEDVRRFLAERPGRRVILQARDADSLRVMRRTTPAAERYLLVFATKDIHRLGTDDPLVELLDGVSVRDSVLTAEAHAWLKGRQLKTFAWTVNDDRRLNQLVERGIDARRSPPRCCSQFSSPARTSCSSRYGSWRSRSRPGWPGRCSYPQSSASPPAWVTPGWPPGDDEPMGSSPRRRSVTAPTRRALRRG